VDTAHFMELCKNGTLSDIQNAVQSGADVNALDDHLRTPLMVAIRFNPHPEIISFLIQSGADVNAKDKAGWTPLMFAARFSANSEVIKILLEKGADAKARDKSGKKAIDYARENPALLNSEILSQLEEMGRD